MLHTNNSLAMDLKIFPTVDKIAQKSILHARLDMTVQEVSRMMQQQNVSSVVIDHGDRNSILSIEDLLMHLNNGGQGSDSLHHLPEHRLGSISGGQHILSALEMLNNSGDRYLAVQDHDGSLLGIMTYTDLLSAADPTLLIDNKTIGELISRSVPVAFSADWFLEDVLCHFKKLEDSIVIVEDGTPLGIITTKDIFRIVATGSPVDRPLSAYMTQPVVTVKSSTTVSDAFVQLKANRIKRLVVINDQNKLAGVITQSELVGFVYGSWITLSKHHSGELRELVSILDENPQEMPSELFADGNSEIGNRQRLMVEISFEIDRIRRYRCPAFSLLLISQQRQSSSGLLKEIMTTRLSNSLRTTDRLFHWDEQSFAVLLPQTGQAQAELLIARIQQILAEQSTTADFELIIDCHPFATEQSATAFIENINKTRRQGHSANNCQRADVD